MTMWRGLHDPDYHEDITEYEVERLTAERDALREKVQRVERLLEVEVLRAQVQRVRDVLGDVGNVYAPPVVFVDDILTALDGATNE